MDVLGPVISILVVSALLVFWAWMFWDMTNNDSLTGNVKYTWTLAFVFLSLFAAVYYFLYEYRDR